MNKLTPGQIIMTYNKITGSSYTIDSKEVDHAEIRDIIATAWQVSAEDDSKYVHPDVQTRAAIQCLEIARRKPFPDSNIKTAILSTITMLELNGIYIKLNEITAPELAKRLTHPDTGYGELSDWLKAHTFKSMK